jgi:uncharacterized protein YjbI with pentapeptide repeats
MIDINHRSSGRPVLSLDADTLESANLAGQYLIHADLRGADLSSALLLFANLSGADLRSANLTKANLRGANLTEVDLSGADFSGVNLTGATMSLTILSGCRNLHKAIGLESVLHPGPSELDSVTLTQSAARLPDSFLKGVGYTRSEIAYLRRAYPETPE